MDLWLWIVVLAAGALGGFIDNAAGMGFGAFSSTFMVAGGVSPPVAVSSVNLAKVGGGLASGIAHWRLGNIRWAWVPPLLIAGLAGGVLGALLLSHLPKELARLCISATLLGMGLLILWRFLLRPLGLPLVSGAGLDLAAAVPRGVRWPAFRVWNLASRQSLRATGFLAGLTNGVSGAFGPVATSLVVLRGEHPRHAIGTVNFVEFFVAGAVSATLLSQVGFGDFLWQLPIALTLGSVVTAPVGAYLSKRLPAKGAGVAVGATLVALNLWSLIRVAL